MSWQEKEERRGALSESSIGFPGGSRGALPVTDCGRDLVGVFPAVDSAAGLVVCFWVVTRVSVRCALDDEASLLRGRKSVISRWDTAGIIGVMVCQTS